ncbi:hypothetical protein BH09BAC6_BH09BAC6_05520 [soil metagenome]|jgi:hypothetical protein
MNDKNSNAMNMEGSGSLQVKPGIHRKQEMAYRLLPDVPWKYISKLVSYAAL